MALSPHVSPDGSRVAFSGVSNAEWQILMYSLELNRQVTFPSLPGSEPFARVVFGRKAPCVLLVSLRRRGDLLS